MMRGVKLQILFYPRFAVPALSFNDYCHFIKMRVTVSISRIDGLTQDTVACPYHADKGTSDSQLVLICS